MKRQTHRSSIRAKGMKWLCFLLVICTGVYVLTSCQDEGEEDPNGHISLDKLVLNVPAQGGEFTVRVTSGEKVTLNPTYGNAESTIPVISESIYPQPETHVSCEGKKIRIVVSPTKGKLKNDKIIRLFSTQSSRYADLHICQDGNADGQLYSNEGLDHIRKNIIMPMWTAQSAYQTLDSEYTELLDFHAYRFDGEKIILPTSAALNIFYRKLMDLYDRVDELDNVWKKSEDTNLQAIIDIYRGWVAGICALLWNDVPDYQSGAVSASTNMAGHDQLMQWAKTALDEAVNLLPEQKAVQAKTTTQIAEASKDVARWLLAQLKMEEGNYEEARQLLRAICANNFYALTNEVRYSPSSEETLWGVSPFFTDQFWADDNRDGILDEVWLTYADVLLSLAECELRTGNTAEADRIIQEVATAKGLTVTSDDTVLQLQQMRAALSVGRGHYFLFLRRNGLAESELGLETYQLLLPLPAIECPNARQNPGY